MLRGHPNLRDILWVRRNDRLNTTDDSYHTLPLQKTRLRSWQDLRESWCQAQDRAR